jgi:hypothetical protein
MSGKGPQLRILMRPNLKAFIMTDVDAGYYGRLDEAMVNTRNRWYQAMNYLHSEYDLEAGDVVVVDLNNQANVMLMDGANYDAYRNNRNYRYYGGFAEKAPARIGVPRKGHWYVVVNLGGYAGSVSARVHIEKSGRKAI